MKGTTILTEILESHWENERTICGLYVGQMVRLLDVVWDYVFRRVSIPSILSGRLVRRIVASGIDSECGAVRHCVLRPRCREWEDLCTTISTGGTWTRMGPTVSVTTTEAIPYILYWFDHDEG